MCEPYAFDSFGESWSYCHAPFPSGKACALRRGHAGPCFEPRVVFPTQPDGYYSGPQFNVPPTERMPYPCACCGKIHAPKRKTLHERVRVGR